MIVRCPDCKTNIPTSDRAGTTRIVCPKCKATIEIKIAVVARVN